MSYENKIKNKISKLSKFDMLTYVQVRETIKSIDNHTLYKIMTKLEHEGYIKRTGRGKFCVEEKPQKKLIFIYGSLKKGFDNHHVIEKAKYKCKAKTVQRFPMFAEKNANYPYLIKQPSKKYHNIKGELYEILHDEILQKLDRFEDAPDYYERHSIKIETYNGKIKNADAYFIKKRKIPDKQKPLEEWVECIASFDEYYNKRVHHC